MKKKYCVKKAAGNSDRLYQLGDEQIESHSQYIGLAVPTETGSYQVLAGNRLITDGVEVFRLLGQQTKSLLSSVTSEDDTARLLVDRVRTRLKEGLSLKAEQSMENVLLLNVTQQLVRLAGMDEFPDTGNSDMATLLGTVLKTQLVYIRIGDIFGYCPAELADDFTDMLKAIQAGGDGYWISLNKIYPEDFGATDDYGIDHDPTDIPATDRDYLLLCTKYKSADRIKETAAHLLRNYHEHVGSDEIELLVC